MRVLVACEFSGVVRDAFIAAGHEAVSCDLLPSERPGPHIQGDVLNVVYPDGTWRGRPWDLLIAHPPCTFLANSGVRWLHTDPSRWAKMRDGAAFFTALLNAPVPRVAVENPVMHKYARELIGAGPTQTVQPYQFGHPESKRTGLWLRGLPPLTPTALLALPASGHWMNQTPSGQNKLSPGPTRAAERARTYEGIAAAMARQWGRLDPAKSGDVIEPLGYQLMLAGEDADIFTETIGIPPLACTGCGAIGWHTDRCPTRALDVTPR